jgi:hypothetical protein
MHYKYFTFWFLVELTAGVTGCATQKSPPPTVGFVAVACPQDKSLVYLYRSRFFILNKGIKMYVNDEPVVTLGGYEYCPLILDPGFTIFSHETESGPYGVFHSIMDDMALELQPGKTYFVAYRFSINPFQHQHPRPWMVLVDPATGTNEMSSDVLKKPL